MIEVLLKNKTIEKVDNLQDASRQQPDFHVMQVIDYSPEETQWLKETFSIDLSILERYEDIEISSHFLPGPEQVAFHISIPYYNEHKVLVESPVFFIITEGKLFVFSNSAVDAFFNKTYWHKFSHLQDVSQTQDILKFQVEFIADYFADITESETKKVKALASTILIEKTFSNDVMDLITRYNFNNLLLKESLIETTRVFNLYKKNSWGQQSGIKETIETELNDLFVVSDYIQFNFDRLDDLKENVGNKIDVEQNQIFKRLTVVTVCISLPTFIAGLYGMNFQHMPELNTIYGYPLALLAMVLAAGLPYLYFKTKKWL